MVSQEVSQLCGGEHTAITGIVSEHGIQLGPPQQLPAELLNLYVIQSTIAGAVTPLRHTGGSGMGLKTQTIQHTRRNTGTYRNKSMLLFWVCASYHLRGKHLHNNSTQLRKLTLKKWFSEEGQDWKLHQEGA